MDRHLRMAEAAQGMEDSTDRKRVQRNGQPKKGRAEAKLSQS
jgi:hypothetical protein